MKKDVSKLVVVGLFILSIVSIFTLNIFISNDSALDEKKQLASWPKKFSNDYLIQINEYYKDKSPLRNFIIDKYETLQAKLGFFYVLNIAPKIDTLLGNTLNEYIDDGSQVEYLYNLYNKEDADILEELDNLHNYDQGTIIEQSTCSKLGKAKYICQDCGFVRIVDIPKTEHHYHITMDKKASIHHDGVTVKVCEECGDIKVENIVLRTSLDEFKQLHVGSHAHNNSVLGKAEWVYYGAENNIDYYKGTNVLTEDEMQEYVDTFNRLKDICDQKGINLVVCVGCGKPQVYPEYMPNNITVVTENKRELVLKDYIESHSKINYVYPLQQLKAYKVFYETYHQQDTHWNQIGGLVFINEVYKKLGMDSLDILKANVEYTTKKGGDLSNLAGIFTEYEDYNVIYKPEIEVQTTYYKDTFVENDAFAITTANCSNQAKAYMVGDSYRGILTKYIQKDFAKTTSMHRYDMEKQPSKDALKELTKGDVIIIISTERYDYYNVEMANKIIEMLR